MRRLLTLLALLAPAGCIVGPQEDLPPITPGQARDDDGSQFGEGGSDDEADGDADPDLDGEPPLSNEDYPDDGDSLPADAAGEDDPSGMIPNLDGQTVPGIPMIPRPGLQSPKPEEPDLDSAVTLPAVPSFETVDEPSDEPTDA